MKLIYKNKKKKKKKKKLRINWVVKSAKISSQKFAQQKRVGGFFVAFD